MKKNTALIFIIVVLVVILIFFSFFNKHQYRRLENSPEADFKPSYKTSYLEGTETEHLDSTTKIYSNFKYGFSMDFPDKWSIDRGVAEHTVIRAVEKDSLITFSISVIEVDGNNSNISIWTVWDKAGLKMKELYLKNCRRAVNSKIYNFESRKTYIDNWKAIEMKINYIQKSMDAEYEVQGIAYQIIKGLNTYTIGIQIPKIFYDINPERYDELFFNFVFLVNR